jgi:hypothetical protein
MAAERALRSRKVDRPAKGAYSLLAGPLFNLKNEYVELFTQDVAKYVKKQIFLKAQSSDFV